MIEEEFTVSEACRDPIRREWGCRLIDGKSVGGLEIRDEMSEETRIFSTEPVEVRP
jgi:hypothetical protein